jgi:hypothetical protein
LPILAILIALPAGENPAYEGDIPWVAFIYVYLLPVWIALVGLAVLIHKLVAWIRSRPRRPKVAGRSARVPFG